MAAVAKAAAAAAKNDEPAPEPPHSQSVALGGIDAARAAAKWLVGALAAVAALLVAGTQLSSIGAAEGWRLAIAVAGAVVGLSALGFGLFATFDLMMPVALSLDQLENRGWERSKDPSIKFLRDNESVFLGEATNVVELRTKIRAAERELDAALKKHHRTPEDKDLEAKAEVAGARLQQLDDIATSVTEFGTYAAFSQRQADWKRVMAVVLVVVGLALVGFAWAANPPPEKKDDSSAVAPEMRGVVLKHVDLSRSNLSGVDLSYARLTGVNLQGAITDGAKWVGVVWKDVTCVDGSNSDEVGHTCDGHLGAE